MRSSAASRRRKERGRHDPRRAEAACEEPRRIRGSSSTAATRGARAALLDPAVSSRTLRLRTSQNAGGATKQMDLNVTSSDRSRTTSLLWKAESEGLIRRGEGGTKHSSTISSVRFDESLSRNRYRRRAPRRRKATFRGGPRGGSPPSHRDIRRPAESGAGRRPPHDRKLSPSMTKRLSKRKGEVDRQLTFPPTHPPLGRRGRRKTSRTDYARFRRAVFGPPAGGVPGTRNPRGEGVTKRVTDAPIGGREAKGTAMSEILPHPERDGGRPPPPPSLRRCVQHDEGPLRSPTSVSPGIEPPPSSVLALPGSGSAFTRVG